MSTATATATATANITREDYLGTIKSNQLANIVNLCMPCRKDTSSRYGGMHGVRIEVTAKSIIAVATDGKQLVRVVAPAEIASADLFKPLCLDFKPLKKLLDRLSVTKPQPVEITRIGSQIVFSWSNGRYGKSKREYNIPCPIIEGRYPDWRRVVVDDYGTKSAKATVGFSPKQWAQNYAAFAAERGAKLTINGKATVEISMPQLPIDEHTGEDIALCIDFAWLADHLSRLVCDTAKLYFWAADKAIRIESVGSTYILMPRS